MPTSFLPLRHAGALFLATLLSVSGADTSSDIQAQLDRPLLAVNLTADEAQRFSDTRVPRMPAVKTAAEWTSIADTLRRKTLDQVVFRGAQAQQWREARAQVVWLETLPGGPGYSIRKLRHEALPGLWIPALLYLPENLRARRPCTWR